MIIKGERELLYSREERKYVTITRHPYILIIDGNGSYFVSYNCYGPYLNQYGSVVLCISPNIYGSVIRDYSDRDKVG